MIFECFSKDVLWQDRKKLRGYGNKQNIEWQRENTKENMHLKGNYFISLYIDKLKNLVKYISGKNISCHNNMTKFWLKQ